MGESTLIVLISLKHSLYIVVDVSVALVVRLRLQMEGFVVNVGQQIPSYVKGRQAGEQMQGELLALRGFGYGGGSSGIIRLPEHCWQ